jgi:hypothetical protein
MFVERAKKKKKLCTADWDVEDRPALWFSSSSCLGDFLSQNVKQSEVSIPNLAG